MRQSIAFAFTVLLTVSTARAELIETTPTLPPPSGIYGVHSTTCLLAGCIVESDIGNLVITSSQIVGGDQLVIANGTLDAAVFQNNSGVPGAPIGSLTLSGTLSITYVGRAAPDLLGSFPAMLTSLDFMGVFNSHILISQLTPGKTSSGLTTITQVPGQNLFLVDSFFDVNAGLTLDGGPFMPQPERHVVLEGTVPEPETIGLILPLLAIIAAVARASRPALRPH
jgi:hypothetical protein